MKYHHIISLVLLILLSSCSGRREGAHAGIDLTGAWVLRHVEYPSGTEQNYTMDGNGTYCLIYQHDGKLYESGISTTPTGLVITPVATIDITLVDQGGGEWLYMENGDPHPLRVSDSSITIQRLGILYTFSRDDQLYSEWGTDIRDITARETADNEGGTTMRYALSVKERRLTGYVYWLVIAIAIVISIAVANFVVYLRRRRQMQLQLQQIREVQTNLAPTVRQAAKTVEDSFFASDEYAALQRRMATGQLMKDEEWQQVEHSLMTVYPGFTTQLRSLYPMSDVEYHTCLLVKLRIPTKDIAAVLAREKNTISTVRSRLYKKVFGHEGGAKEWDEFILFIGT